jgi:hypothetical protein
MGHRIKMEEGAVMPRAKKTPVKATRTPPVEPGDPTKRPRPKVGPGVHKSNIKEIPTKDLYAEIKRRSRTEMPPAPPKKASRWTPAGKLAHKSRGGKK